MHILKKFLTVLNTATELLVRAHDCYAARCHMEGISQVLHTVTSFTPILKSRSEWALMVSFIIYLFLNLFDELLFFYEKWFDKGSSFDWNPTIY